MEAPIGVFDSGLGGLTVLKELVRILPNEDFVYLGDTARIPYGVKSPETVQKYAEQNIKFLTEQGAKAIVVACNSASTIIENINSDIPVIGVIQPGAQAAAATTINKKVGIIGTRTTISKRNYVAEIGNIDSEIKVFQQACPLLVPLVEEGWDNDPITNLIVYRYISPLLASDIDTLVLGCTHYPILFDAIQKVTGNKVSIINSGEAVSGRVKKSLQETRLLNTTGSEGNIRLMTTDNSDVYESMATRLLSKMPYAGVELVNI